ncbi:hypothetical protein, partial [Roseivirga seohaensis]|uniref:hypothetical protein n=1 Tax=Roseivirga seohaensis TaxID=1914963 RepID=UPI001C8775FA
MPTFFGHYNIFFITLYRPETSSSGRLFEPSLRGNGRSIDKSMTEAISLYLKKRLLRHLSLL